MLIHRSLGALKALGEGSKLIQVFVEAVPARAGKEFSRHRAFQKGVRLLRAKISDNQGTANAVADPLTGQRRRRLSWVSGQFLSPQDKISGDWLRQYRLITGVSIFI